MMNVLNGNGHISELFMKEMAGGALVYRAGAGHEILFVNENLIRFFECENEKEFIEFVGNSFDGMVNETKLSFVEEDMEQQMSESPTDSGYVFYNIRTKQGNGRRVVNHFTKITDEKEGEIICAMLYAHRHDNVGSDFDSVTGLYGKKHFHKYVSKMNRSFLESLLEESKESTEVSGKISNEYAIIYLNLVHFKLLNIEKGVEEGDTCLKVMANTLRESYEDAFIARISGDHFAIFTKKEQIYEKTEEAAKKFYETYGNQFGVIGKFGIYELEFGKTFDVEASLSFAKMACDFIKHDATKDIAMYSDQLVEEVKTTEYVVGKIDDAIKNEWIKVYYQPVVRSLTGGLCGMESLARWDDPVVGFLPPDRFIGALERERCIHKLDSYIVKKVCECLHDRIVKKQPVVPVSVNFSRLDFVMCDMLEIVEKAVEQYDIPRDYIHIEITESMLASDEELMHRVMEGFREAGYEIWMDDFGSGYSSLTLLKDFQFDTLKLDMRFLSPFTEKSKSIICSVITMAKDIGIRTLAEGVETEEQLEFLRSVGCGMIQGYYYGKPQPIEDTYAHIAEKFIPIETRKWRHFYEVAGFCVRETDVPLEVIEDDGKEFRTLFMNQSYRNQIFDKELTIPEIDRRIYQTKSPLVKKYREIAKRLERSGKQETFYYTDNGNYMRFRGQCIAEHEGHYLIKGSLVNISSAQEQKEKERLESKLRELHFLFEEVLLLNLSEKNVLPLLRGFQYAEFDEKDSYSLEMGMDIMTSERVFPSERIRCHEFLDPYSLRDRIDRSGRGYITDVFHIRQFDGSYQAREMVIMMVSGTGGNEFLFCMRPYMVKFVEQNRIIGGELPEMEELPVEYGNLWNNLIWNSRVKCFWKDKKCRIQGVSQAFLDYYGLDSLEEVIGKTDEQMNWYVDGEKHAKDETNILNKGEHVIAAPVRCIAKGAVHNIICSKMPVYQNGKIIGLMGYFDDEEDAQKRLQKTSYSSRIDEKTGLMNVHAFLDILLDYAMEYRDYGQDYALAVFYNKNHDRILQTYGPEFTNKVLKEIADTILQITGQICVVARTKGSVFAVLTHLEDRQAFCEIAEEIEAKTSKINVVDGNPVTVRMEYSMKFRSDECIVDENIYEEALRGILEDF